MCDIEKLREVAIAFLNLEVKNANYGIVYHPVFESIVYPDKDGSMLNLMNEEDLKKARAIVKDIICKLDAEYIIYSIRTPYRLLFVKYTEPYLDEKTYAEWLKNAWIESENPNRDTNISLNEIKDMFSRAKPEYLMDEDEYKKFTNLPPKILVYRGIGEKSNPNGFAWTTNFDIAAWFAQRFNDEGYILQMDVPKERVMACFDSRGEYEIVCDPRKIKKITL